MKKSFDDAVKIMKSYVKDDMSIFNEIGPCGCCCSSHGGGKARYQDKVKKDKKCK